MILEELEQPSYLASETNDLCGASHGGTQWWNFFPTWWDFFHHTSNLGSLNKIFLMLVILFLPHVCRVLGLFNHHQGAAWDSRFTEKRKFFEV